MLTRLNEENSKIFKISHILIFFLCAFASLPIFFDLSTGELIFIKNLYELNPFDRPRIPLPLSSIFFGAILFFEFFPTLNNLVKRKFNIFLFCIFFLSSITIINGIPIFKLLQLIMPLIILFTLPIVIKNCSKYCAYAFVYSIFCFSVLHFFYYYQFSGTLNCTDNCNSIFLGYEIYHASVGFPDVIVLGLSTSLFIFASIKSTTKKIQFSIVPIVLFSYFLFLSKASSLLMLIVSTTLFFLVIIIKILIKLRINKFIFLSFLSSILFISFFYKNIYAQLSILPFKVSTLFSGDQARLEVWKDNINGLLDNPITLLFGGLTRQVGGHNYFLSILSLIGFVGLILLISCYYIIMIELKKKIRIEGIFLNEIKLFSITLTISSLIVGSFLNDSLTQPFNIFSLYAFTISIISYNDWYINKEQTLKKIISSPN